jgi:hypothetical protein
VEIQGKRSQTVSQIVKVEKIIKPPNIFTENLKSGKSETF